MKIGLFEKKSSQGGLRTYFFRKTLELLGLPFYPWKFPGKQSFTPGKSPKLLLEIPRPKKRDAWKIHMTHGYSNHSNLEMEAECLTKNLSCLNLDISTTKYGRNKL